MRNALVATGAVFAVVWIATSGAVRGWVLLLVFGAGMVWALSRSGSRAAPKTAKGKTPPARTSPLVTAAGVTGWLWRHVARPGATAGRAAVGASAVPAQRAWNLRRLWWAYGPGHHDLALRCRYCRHRSHTADEALAHADTHPHDYLAEMARGANGWTRPPPDVPPRADPPHDQPAPAPEPADTDVQEDDVTQPMLSVIGTAGRAAVAGLIVDWQSSEEARSNWETFVAWLQAEAAAADHAAAIVPDLVTQHHGRGPSGHAGVPEEIIGRFSMAFAEARAAEANAYRRFAAEYAAYVEQAETLLNQTYGREVLAQAHAAHH